MESKDLKLVQALKSELAPALGCTEPIAIAYGSACAVEALGRFPDRLIVEASANIIKNVKSVIVPNSRGMKGIEAAAVLGALSGRTDLKLEVLSALTEDLIDQAAALLRQGFCEVRRLSGGHSLHLIVHALAGEDEARAEIVDQHTNLVDLSRNGERPAAFLPPPREESTAKTKEQSDFDDASLAGLIRFAAEAPLDDFREVLETQLRMNRAICLEGLSGDWGSRTGKLNLSRVRDEDDFFRQTRYRAIAMASAGSDARMSGCVLPVVINSGSGNQGMTVSMPVLVFAEAFELNHETLLRGLALANLIALYQKSNIGRLSAFCGAVSAATGAVAGISWMLGGAADVIEATIINSLACVSGMICDGAKASCAAKISTALNTAFDAYDLARAGFRFAAGDGIVKEDADGTIRAVGRMASEGMRATDAKIIEIMLEE